MAFCGCSHQDRQTFPDLSQMFAPRKKNWTYARIIVKSVGIFKTEIYGSGSHDSLATILVWNDPRSPQALTSSTKERKNCGKQLGAKKKEYQSL